MTSTRKWTTYTRCNVPYRALGSHATGSHHQNIVLFSHTIDDLLRMFESVFDLICNAQKHKVNL